MSENDKKILNQNVSDAELEQVSGGELGDYPHVNITDADADNCVKIWRRNIYWNKFPNCAATVEDGSWCEQNDACLSNAVQYMGMKSCAKAHE